MPRPRNEAGFSAARPSEFTSGPGEAELKSSLLAAVGQPTQPYRKGEFVELARRVIAEERGA